MSDKFEINNLFDDDEDIEKLEDKTVESKYSTKTNIPQYIPRNEKPTIDAMFDRSKYDELVERINASDVSEEDKKFLRLAATRHIVFNYSIIADYYANSSASVQRLMEESALVIIDIDDAIANGYVELTDRLRDIMRQGKEFERKSKKYGVDE